MDNKSPITVQTIVNATRSGWQAILDNFKKHTEGN